METFQGIVFGSTVLKWPYHKQWRATPCGWVLHSFFSFFFIPYKK